MGTAAVRVDELSVPMGDGTVLAADVVTVDDGVARPTLLVRSPYSRAASRAAEDPVGLAKLGWSVVIQDVRGRFDSQGTFDPFRQERQDGADTVAWCAAQPWCDGRVVGWGASYLGATQWLAATGGPRALRAVAPMVAPAITSDGAAWAYEGGALQLGWVMPWSLLMAASDPRADADALAGAAELATDFERLYAHPLDDHPVRKVLPAFDEWLNSGGGSPSPKKVTVPAFHIAGWYDLFAESSLRGFQVLANRAGPAQRIVVGPWTHVGLFAESTPEMAFGAAAGPAADARGEALRWVRRAIDGESVEGGARLFLMGTNEWREFPTWPPPSQPTELFLAPDGGLEFGAPADHTRDSYDYNPDDPVPTRGGRTLGPYLPMAGPVDQRPIEARSDVLVYTSAPLTRDLTVIGPVTATIRFATSGQSADVAVKLIDVHPDGRGFNVVDSVRRLAFTPGRARDVAVDVGSTAQTFLAGHRIRVHVSSSNFPRLDRNPSAGMQTVHVGGTRPSRITLPVMAK